MNGGLALEVEVVGPRRADRAVVLAPGAGSDRHAPVLVAVAEALAAAGVPSLRLDFSYRTAGRRAPPRAPVLVGELRAAARELARHTGLAPERLILGGRSMGGRMASLLAADPEEPWPALGLLLLGYPLHPAGRPQQRRVEHFPVLRCPVLFVSGTRDALAPRDALIAEARRIPGPVSFHWLESADHAFRPRGAGSGSSPTSAPSSEAVTSFRPRAAGGRTVEDVIAEVARVSAEWVGRL